MSTMQQREKEKNKRQNAMAKAQQAARKIVPITIGWH